ncbi:hypothetical protein GUITHDRAFT_142087 [Guillardia theta CCMP2712]|uniref:Uncharacterized protein n=2 Tax=Guillardia theta TaxID=55529 RepID=L1IZR6_GUITC|nr:hypothetical protein GUITHDRAFT_142087 [Guillardia theta CCMP2712]EKX41399.1 hypothetical protein GUITHDRAFT_142087 [Guillardia theta CCMP2712]|eukprot:XP_005828379.1 hypothetical protein GUITHDRAFT_142087 [Guillardia theta CCMP2712]
MAGGVKVLLLLAMGELAHSDLSTYRYAKITWTSCEQGFYDPLFPDTCKDSSSPLDIGVTVSAAWDIRDLSETSMILLSDALQAKQKFLTDPASAKLSLTRGDPMGKYRKIGYRTLDATSTTDVDCSRDKNCDATNYYLRIDHLSPDGNVIFCRFSFTASLSPQGTVHLLQFEGCCRLDRYTYENLNLAASTSKSNFEISATVITDGVAPLQTRSPQISSPYLVELTSTTPICTPPSFPIQAFHPLDQYKDSLGDLWWVAKIEVMSAASCGATPANKDRCSSAIIDFLIHVQVLPITTMYSLPAVANPDSFLSPRTTRNQYFSIQCNTEDFEFSSVKTRTLRIGFRNPAMPSSNNSLDWIFQNNDFPSIGISPVKWANNYGYVDLTWRPHCEDPSQQTCSADCVSCCGELNCTIPNNATCCRRAHAIRGASFQMDVKAITQDYVQRVDVNFSFPEAVLPVPTTIQKKWGCDTGQVTVRFSYAQGQDSMTGIYKICYQAVQVSDPLVNNELWARFYGGSYTQNSCLVCIALRIESEPFFVETTLLQQGSTDNSVTIPLAVGRTLRINLLAAYNMGGSTASLDIFPLSEPGLPSGGVLSATKQVNLTGSAVPTAFQRSFDFTPHVGQQAQTFSVCFAAKRTDIALQTPLNRCYIIQVYEATVFWKVEKVGTSNVIELRYLRDTVTVGCPVSYFLYAKSQFYNIELEPDFNSTCDGCALNETYVASVAQ